MNIHSRELNRMPDHISRQPWYEKARRVAERNKSQMKFESPGAERDYWRRIGSNPMNMPYCPEFFPPKEIKEFMSFVDSEADRERFINQKITELEFVILNLACIDCHPISHRWGGVRTRVTEHHMDTNSCVCTLCGKDKDFRTRFTQVSREEISSDTTPTSQLSLVSMNEAHPCQSK